MTATVSSNAALEKKNGCSYGWELIVVWFGVVGVGVFGFVFVGCVGLVVFLCWFCCSSRSVSFLVAFTQKM